MEKKKKILMVDDETETLAFLKNTLDRAGYEVLVAATGKKAIELSQREKPDVIVLDIVLPDISGGEIADILLNDPETSTIPIIFLTGLDAAEDARVIRQKAKNYYVLAKPITPAELIRSLGTIIVTAP